jgi:DNA mismatch repair protein MutS
VITPAGPFAFAAASAAEVLKRHFGIASLQGYGIEGRAGATAAAGGLLTYLQETQKSPLQHVDGLVLHEPSRFLLLDPATRRNLEIERTLRGGERKGSLVHVVDSTLTAAGGRLQQRFLLAPLLDVEEIRQRQDAVQELFGAAGREAPRGRAWKRSTTSSACSRGP